MLPAYKHDAEAWFLDESRAKYANAIRVDRLAYEKALEEDATTEAVQNAVQEELADLKAKVEKLLAEKDEPPVDVEPEVEPEVEPDAEETDETDEDETDEPDADEAGEE